MQKCTLENVVSKVRDRAKRNPAVELETAERIRRFIAERAPDFDEGLIPEAAYRKVLEWMARYQLHQSYLKRKEQGIPTERGGSEGYVEFNGKKIRFIEPETREATEEENPRYDPPEKGLLLLGPAGRGKTTCARVIGSLFGFLYATMDELDMRWGRNPEECERDYSEFFSGSTPIIIDDLGTEAGTKHYGNQGLGVQYLCRLYDLWRWEGKLIIMTTNLSPFKQQAASNQQTILESYGERIDSRFYEMFEYVPIIGSYDIRRSKSNVTQQPKGEKS